MIAKVFLQEIVKELNCKDNRTAMRWCRIHNILVMKDSGSNRLYVLKNEFETAWDNEIIKNKRVQNGIKSSDYSENKTNFGYKPTGEIEQGFLESSIFTNI